MSDQGLDKDQRCPGLERIVPLGRVRHPSCVMTLGRGNLREGEGGE